MSREIKKLRKLNKFWLTWNIMESLVLLAGGVLAIVAGIISESGSSNIENAIAYTVGSFVILDGILRIILFLSRYREGSEQSPMVIAGFEISMGILLFLLQTKFAADHIFTFTVVNFVAIILIVMGALVMTVAIFSIVRRMAKLFMPVVEILFSAILMGVGIVIEVLFNTENSRQKLVLILTGVILTLAAIGMLIVTIVSWRKGKKELDQAEDEEYGDYEIDDDGPRKRRRKVDVVEPKPAEIIEAQEYVDEQPDQNNPQDRNSLGGPRAIGRKDD